MGDSLKPYYKAAPMPDLEVGTYSAGNEEAWWCFKQGNGGGESATWGSQSDNTVESEVRYTDEQLVQSRMDQSPVRVMLKKELSEGSESLDAAK